MAQEKVYSKQLGSISEVQFQAALDHFDLGQFVRAEPIPFGLFGQNVFISSTAGEFVLRGKPHFWWQFPTEQFYSRFLHGRTPIPAPWPYRIDPTPDIFGWSYVLMPRMPGLQLADPEVRARLNTVEKRAIARTLGETAALLQTVTVPFSGRYSAVSNEVEPFDLAYELAWPLPVESDGQLSEIAATQVSFSERVKACVRCHLANAQASNSAATTQADLEWVEERIADAEVALDDNFVPSLVIQDFKEANLVVTGQNEQWQVSGVFDLMEAHFGDGEANLSRQYAIYLDEAKDSELARDFVRAYLNQITPRPGFAKRFRVYMLLERTIVWSFVQRHELDWWDRQRSFREWVSRYMPPDDYF